MINICGHTIDDTLIKHNPAPTVLDLGGYDGDFARGFFEHYPNAFIITFEPTPGLCKSHQGNWLVIGKAAWIRDGNAEFSVCEGAHFKNSLIIPGGKKIYVETVDLVPLLKTISFDVIKIDIEGAEYELIEHWIKNNALKEQEFAQLSIEFHDFLDPALCVKTTHTIAALYKLDFIPEFYNGNIDVLFK